jgi:hypothetical protein
MERISMEDRGAPNPRQADVDRIRDAAAAAVGRRHSGRLSAPGVATDTETRVPVSDETGSSRRPLGHAG